MKGLPFDLACLVAVLNALDNWTTWICLRDPDVVPGQRMIEANPVAAWSFELLGLTPALIIEYLITLGALYVIVKSGAFKPRVKLVILGLLCLLSGAAVMNNFSVIQEAGLLQ